MLKAYEMYGGGKLTPEEENRYWAECAIAAEFQTCDPNDVPATSDGVRAYFEQMRPHLAVSEAALRMMDHLLNAKVVPPAPPALKPAVEIINWFLRAGTIATMPRWMRRLSGFDQPRIVDIGVRPVLTLSFGIINRIPRLKLAVAGLIAPSMVPVAAPTSSASRRGRRKSSLPPKHGGATATPNRRTRISNCGPSNTIACSAKANHPATKD